MAKRSKNELSLQVLKKFRVIYGSARQQFKSVEAKYGITGSQLWLLQEISKTPEIGVSELAECLSIHQSTCSQLVGKLAVRGLVVKKRSNEDQRRVGLCVTQSALVMLKDTPGPAEGILPEALQSLSESALLSLDGALFEVINRLSIRNDAHADKHLSEL